MKKRKAILETLVWLAVLWVLMDHDVDPTNGAWGEVLRINDEVSMGAGR